MRSFAYLPSSKPLFTGQHQPIKDLYRLLATNEDARHSGNGYHDAAGGRSFC